MPTDNALLLNFVNESVRPVADRLAGLLPLPDAILNACIGQGLCEVLGTTPEDLLAGPWTDEMYQAVPVDAIVGSDGGGRTLLTNHHVIGILRVLAAVKYLADSNPALGPLLGAVAVNPRA